MKFEYLTGDLLTSDEKVIAHGCNTMGFMGSGIAAQVAERWPDVEMRYRKTCTNKEFVIGTAQALWTGPYPDSRLIFNLGTQERTGADASAWGVFLSFANMAERCYRLGINRVGVPRIGAGIGGLQWDDVAEAIEDAIDRSSGP